MPGPASSTLLQLMGEGADQQIAAEPLRRAGAIQFAPCKPQFLRRAIEQIDKMTVDLGDVLTGRSAGAVAASSGNRRRLATVLASRCVVGWWPHALAGSAMRYTRPRSSVAEARVSPSFFFKVPEKTPRTV